jgi:transcriptional regulator with XRE-family HTH domain
MYDGQDARIGVMMQIMSKASDLNPTPVRENAIEERIRVNLETFIEQSGYSMNQVADLSGIPQASVGRYVRGVNAISAEALKALADVFGRSVNDFYERTPPPPPADLQNARPAFLKPRPGVQLSEEDFAEFEEFLTRVQARRAKKSPAKAKPKKRP